MPLDEDARALLGARLLAARRAARLTGQEVADRLPRLREGTVTRQLISQWERGTRTPSLDRLADLARALGTAPEELLRGVR